MLVLFFSSNLFASTVSAKTKDAIIYNLSIEQKTVNITGKDVKAMLINGSLPAPPLYFKEGKRAIVYVTNKMVVPTSVHWHGILLPNIQDGVPYLTSPPILPGKTHKFEFRLQQSGTYWYHSHTGLQEQRGLYGAIVVEPKKKKYVYKRDLILVLSDWTNDNPREILRTLKRGSEWYAMQKGTTQSLFRTFKDKTFLHKLKMEMQRMSAMDISDVYYDAFLVNGKKVSNHFDFKTGERVRVRVVNAAASTYFWLNFIGNEDVSVISADGLNVKPFTASKILHAVAETYDFLVTIPKRGFMEIHATAQDNSGFSRVRMGSALNAPKKQSDHPENARYLSSSPVADKTMDHSKHSKKVLPNSPPVAGKTMDHSKHSKKVLPNSPPVADKTMDHSKHSKKVLPNSPPVAGKTMDHSKHSKKVLPNSPAVAGKTMDHSKHSKKVPSSPVAGKTMDHSKHSKKASSLSPVAGKTMDHSKHSKKKASSSYDQLRSMERTVFSKKNTVRDLHFNLTGNMRRYVWSINNRVLSRSDLIEIKKGETVRIHLHNKTMMHHPMHLHGHFFRVLNRHGEYSPLKHTVDVPPHQTVVIEFDPNIEGNWFFHCHVLYHMKSGMSRVFTNGSKRDPSMDKYPISTVLKADSKWYHWAELGLRSNRLDFEFISSNVKNKVRLDSTVSWANRYYDFHKNLEAGLSYEYFTNDFFRPYVGMEVENRKEGILDQIEDVEIFMKLGFRYLLPFLFEGDMSIDHRANLRVELEYETLVFSQTEFFAELEWKLDLNSLERDNLQKSFISGQSFEWDLGIHHQVSRRLALVGSYSNHFGWGAGIELDF